MHCGVASDLEIGIVMRTELNISVDYGSMWWAISKLVILETIISLISCHPTGDRSKLIDRNGINQSYAFEGK